MTAGITSRTFTKCKWRIQGHGDQLEIYDSVSCYITAGISSTVIKCNSRTKSTTDIFRWYMTARITVITCEWRIRGYADLLRTYDLLMREHGDNIMRTNGLPCESFSHVVKHFFTARHSVGLKMVRVWFLELCSVKNKNVAR